MLSYSHQAASCLPCAKLRRFDIKWLLPEYRDLDAVRNHGELSEKQKSVLEGVHTRDFSNGQLAADPSKHDYEILNRAYGE